MTKLSAQFPPYYPDHTEQEREGEEVKGKSKGLRGKNYADKLKLEPKPRPQQATCPKCGLTGDPFWMRVHMQNCEDIGKALDLDLK